jgi:hypothetical protein
MLRSMTVLSLLLLVESCSGSRDLIKEATRKAELGDPQAQ